MYFYSIKEKALLLKDFYTRGAWVYILNKKTKEEVVQCLDDFYTTVGKPKEVIFDAGREFVNSDLDIYLNKQNIRRHAISVENHRANGRIERLNRDINST